MVNNIVILVLFINIGIIMMSYPLTLQHSTLSSDKKRYNHMSNAIKNKINKIF